MSPNYPRITPARHYLRSEEAPRAPQVLAQVSERENWGLVLGRRAERGLISSINDCHDQRHIIYLDKIP